MKNIFITKASISSGCVNQSALQTLYSKQINRFFPLENQNKGQTEGARGWRDVGGTFRSSTQGVEECP